MSEQFNTNYTNFLNALETSQVNVGSQDAPKVNIDNEIDSEKSDEDKYNNFLKSLETPQSDIESKVVSETIEPVDIGTGLPEQFTVAEERPKPVGFFEDPLEFAKENIFQPIAQAKKVEAEGQRQAGAIVSQVIQETVKLPPELALFAVDVVSPETGTAIRESDVGKTISKAVDILDPKLTDEGQIAADLLTILTGVGLGAKAFKLGFDELVKKYGQVKAKKIAERMSKQTGLKVKPKDYIPAGKGIDRARKITAITGGTAGATQMDVQLRDADEQILADILNSSKDLSEAYKSLSVEQLEELGFAESTALKMGNIYEENVPDVIKNAFKALQINPNDSAAKAKTKQYLDSSAFLALGSAVINPILLIGKYGVKGTGQLINKAIKKTKKTIEAVDDGGLEVPPPTPNTAVTESKLVETPTGEIKQQNKVTEIIGKINTTLGRGFTSKAALPDELAELAAKRQFASKGFAGQIRNDLNDLQKIQKKEKVSDDSLASYINNGDDTGLTQPVKEAVDKLKLNIKQNEDKINDLLGLKGDARIGIGQGPDGIYFTRSFESSLNPSYLKKIKKALKGEKVDAEFLNKVNNARTYFLQKGVPENEVDGVIEAAVTKLAKDDKTIIDNILEGTLKSSSSPTVGSRVLAGRKDLDEPILDLLGELKDPYKKLSTTFYNQNKLISELEFLTDVEKFAKASIAKGEEVTLPGLVPKLPSVKTKFDTAAFVDGVDNLGRIADESIGKFGGNKVKILQDIYTSPQMGKYINQGLEIAGQPGGLSSFLGKTSSIIQSVETSLDAPAYLLNLYGAGSSLVLNGHFLNPRNYAQSVKQVKTLAEQLKVGEKAFDAVGLKKNKKAAETVNRLKALGVLDQDITGEMIARNANLYGQGGQKGFSKAFGNFMTKVGNAYGTPDSYAKLIAFQSEFNGLKKALKVKDTGRLTNSEQARLDEVFEMAARNVRDTFPTYGMAPGAARYIARTPIVGNYVLFPTELVRTTKNAVKIGVRDLREGYAQANGRQMARGLSRLTGIATALGAPSLAVNSNNDTMGVGENNRKAINMLSPEWTKGSINYYLEPFVLDETGEGLTKEQKKVFKPYIRTRYVGSTAGDTFDYLKAPTRLVLGKILGSGDISDQEIDNAFGNAAKGALAQFYSPTFLTRSVLNALTGVNPDTGRPFYDQAVGATFKDKAINFTEAVLKGMPGGTVKLATDYFKAKSSEELLGEGNAQRNSGFPLNPDDLVFLLRSGVRPVTTNVNKAIGFDLSKDIKAIAQTKNNFKTEIYKLPFEVISKEAADNLIEKFKTLQERKYVGMQKLAKKANVYKDIDYVRRFKEKGKIKEEPKKLELDGVLAAATNNFWYSADDNLVLATAATIKNDIIESPSAFIPDSPNYGSLMKSLRERGVSSELQDYLTDGLTKVVSEYAGKPLLK